MKILTYVMGLLQRIGLLKIPDEIWLARQHKRKVLRGDISDDHLYILYRDHPMVKNYKW